MQGEVDVLVGTLGKALGSYGAYVCASEEMVRYLINAARPLIFSTAPRRRRWRAHWRHSSCWRSEPQRGGASARGRAHAARARSRARASLCGQSDMHIVPLVVGDSERRDAPLSGGARARRVRAGDPPARPWLTGTSRLRLAVMASHTAGELRHAAKALADAAREVGLDPARLGSSTRPDAHHADWPTSPSQLACVACS